MKNLDDNPGKLIMLLAFLVILLHVIVNADNYFNKTLNKEEIQGYLKTVEEQKVKP